MADILFNDTKHASFFSQILSNMKKNDCYHQSVAYLFALDENCREHIADLFNYEHDNITPSALYYAWQNDSSQKTTRLALNLWYGYYDEYDAKYSTPVELFNCPYAPFYYEAIKLRFPQFAKA